MKNLLFTFFFFAFVIFLQAQEKFVIRIDNPQPQDVNILYKAGFEIAVYKPKVFLDLVVDEMQSSEIKKMGYDFSVTQTTDQLQTNLRSGTDLNGYLDYAQVLAELQDIEAQNPDICKLYDIGDTRGKEYFLAGNSNYAAYNHEIWALKVSDNVLVEEDEPCIFYMAVHHAREPISNAVAMNLLNHLIDNYGSDPDITNSINNKQIWFIPLVNPNGHKIVTDENDVWWRKNIRDNDNNGQLAWGSSPDGVDPNRNYGWQWGGGGSSGDIYSETYRGPFPFSEPEIQSMRDLLGSHHFVTGITYHSYGELVLFPYSYSSGSVAPDHVALEDLAVDVAYNIPGLSGGHYTPEVGYTLYPADGVTDDYAYGQYGIFTFTVELATQFIPPASQIQQICDDNLNASLILLNRVDQSTVTGLVRDASTLDPVVAEVYVDGIDNLGSYKEPYLSDEDFGRYYRFLVDGNYTLTFSAYGYIPQTFNSVNINSADQTILDVYLVQAQTVSVSGTVTDTDTGLPIENATIQIIDTPVDQVTTDEFGYYFIPSMMEGTYTFRVYAENYATILEENTVSVGNTVFDFQLEESNAWSFELGVYEPEWSFGGNAPWFITNEDPFDGVYCSRSGNIGDLSTSEMEITLVLTSGGDVSFARKVSSEATYDFLRFYIDDNLQDEWSGELDWQEVFFPVTSGEHTFKWVYYKDNYVSGGSDCAWVDYIIFPPYLPSPDPADIDVNPMSFEVTLPQDASTDESLFLSNLGDIPLNYSIIKQYPQNKSKAYCSASGGCDEYISRVIFNTIDNPSSCGGYQDFTNLITTVNGGQTYTLTIENGNYYSVDDLAVWIDWNQDEVFDNSTERVVCEVNTGAEGDFDILIPVDAVPGFTTMRIRMKYYGNDCGDPCGTTSYGEVEDYTLNVNSDFVDWLTITPTSGTVIGQDQDVINFNFNSTDLDEGDYYCNAIINSDDFDEPQIMVPCTLHVMYGITLNLKALLEGPYSGTTMTTLLNENSLIPLNQPFNVSPWNYSGTENVASIDNPDITDWVLVELRETSGDAGSANNGTIVDRMACFVLNDGTIQNVEGSEALRFEIGITENLYVVIYHRNHLAVISNEALVSAGGVYNYDFTIDGAYGGSSAQKEVNTGIWGMISGDENGDGIINTDDLILWESQGGTKGYFSTDFNLDIQVDNKDKDDLWSENEEMSTQIPE